MTKKLMHFLKAVICSWLLALPAMAVVLEDFQFSDPNGTELIATVNSANPGTTWSEDTDITNSFTQDGVFRIQKDNTAFGSAGLDIADITSGTVWMVAEFAGWNFTGNVLSSDREEIRFTFLDNATHDPPGSTITAQVELERIDTGAGTTSGTLEINGQALGTGSNIAPASLNLMQTDPFSVVLELDKDANQYSIFYRDGSNPFVALGTGAVDAARNANTVRMVLNNDFNDGPGEFVDLDRFYLTDENPITTDFDILTLEVNSTSGQTKLLNDTGNASFDIDLYRIESASNSLNATSWNSLDAQNYDAIGPGVGESWDESGGSDDGVLSELYLLGSSIFDAGESVSIGAAFRPAGSQDLVFNYRDAATGSVFEGNVVYVTGGVTGDFDGNLAWDCGDIDALVAAIVSGSTDLSFDMNGDGTITTDDITDAGTGWLAVGGLNNPTQTGGNAFLVGDGDLSGAVNGQDFLIWNDNKFTSTAAWCDGDFTANGVVDGADFLAWNNNKFQSSNVLAVPEPSGLLIFGLGGVLLTCRRRVI